MVGFGGTGPHLGVRVRVRVGVKVGVKVRVRVRVRLSWYRPSPLGRATNVHTSNLEYCQH